MKNRQPHIIIKESDLDFPKEKLERLKTLLDDRNKLERLTSADQQRLTIINKKLEQCK